MSIAEMLVCFAASIYIGKNLGLITAFLWHKMFGK